MIVELTGELIKIDTIVELLADYEIWEIVQTGKIAIGRGLTKIYACLYEPVDAWAETWNNKN
ncbi:MAG: hypothetical protein FWG14_14070 [Peptococcaceae bacterium]|nr:hypothetical protein [Peptococcaceae bacterium]